jgi:hypothetical protein
VGKAGAVVVIAVWLGACKGDAGGGITDNTPPTTMPACQRTVVFEHSSAMPSQQFAYLVFSTTTVGRLDITVDWTFATNTFLVALVEANTCTLDHLLSGGNCPALTLADSGGKPRRVSYFASTPTRYGLIIVNTGSQDDAVGAQVVLASTGCPTITAAAAE